MITSRETRRWVIPKGGRMAGKTDSQAAALEAVEEAGVRGDISFAPIGKFRYLKNLSSSESRICVVAVFTLRVTHEMDTWLEADERQRCWMDPEEAARAVYEPELSSLILSFARSSGPG